MADANRRLAGNAAIVIGAGSRADGNGHASAMLTMRRATAMLPACRGVATLPARRGAHAAR